MVEKVVDKKFEAGKPYYLIKWKGFSDKDNTWEPVGHLDGIKNLLAQYDLEHPDKEEEEEKKGKVQMNKKSKKIQKIPKTAAKKTQSAKRKEIPAPKPEEKKPKASAKRISTPKKGASAKKSKAAKDQEEEKPQKIETEEDVKKVEDQSKTQRPSQKVSKGKSKASKTEEIEEEKAAQEGDDFSKNGTLLTDTPIRISDHAILDEQSKSVVDISGRTSLKKIYFQVDWKKRKDGYQPASSFYSYTLLKKKMPLIILDYVEDMVHFD